MYKHSFSAYFMYDKFLQQNITKYKNSTDRPTFSGHFFLVFRVHIRRRLWRHWHRSHSIHDCERSESVWIQLES